MGGPAGAILAESALRLPWAPFLPSSPGDTSWPLISVSCALEAVSVAFVPLMGLCCSKAGVLTPGGDSACTAHPIAHPYLECGRAAGRGGSSVG